MLEVSSSIMNIFGVYNNLAILLTISLHYSLSIPYEWNMQ